MSGATDTKFRLSKSKIAAGEHRPRRPLLQIHHREPGKFDERRWPDPGLDFCPVAPRHNTAVQAAAAGYASHLNETHADVVPFVSIELEEAIAAIGLAGQRDYSTVLHDRYCDWRRVGAAIASALAATSGATSATMLPPVVEYVLTLECAA